MKSPTRRGAIGGIVGLGCSAVLGLGSGAVLARTQISQITLPERPMRLSRRLERSLRDGAKLVVSRSWQVEFAHQGQGIGITGVQLDAEVDAPSSLAPIAAIEQSRSTEDMWPMLLSGDGRILAAGVGARNEDFAAVVREAEQMIARSRVPVSEQDAHREYLGQLGRAGSSLLETMPGDLFFPIGEPVRSSRTVELPGGLIGRFEVAYDAKCAATGAWLDRAEREVVTRIGSDERRAKELWMLAEL